MEHLQLFEKKISIEMFRGMFDNGLHNILYPNVDIAVRICLSVLPTNYLAEWIINYPKSEMCEERFNNFAILAIEPELLSSL